MTEDPTYTFEARSLDDLITIAGLADKDWSITITPEELKSMTSQFLKLQKDTIEAHDILDELNIPAMGKGCE